MNAHHITITPAAALLFNTATALRNRQDILYFTGYNKTAAARLDRMRNRALDSAARELGVHADDIMAVYNLHRGLPIAIGKTDVRTTR